MRIGVVGATGAVGEEIVHVLRDRKVIVDELRLFASEKSAGKTRDTFLGDITLQTFSVEACKGLDVVFLAVSGSFSLTYAHAIIEATGAVVIDNSSAFRMDPNVPLVIPEINGHTAQGHKLIANPNCTTAIAAMALWPIHCRFGIASLIMSTYQAASGSGAEGMSELQQQTNSYVNKEQLQNKVFAYPLLFNVIPHIDVFLENGYTKEEMKVAWETRKIFGCPNMDISCTAVRIPTLRAHAEAITLETVLPVTCNGVYSSLESAIGVDIVDDPENRIYPMPLNASAKENVEVGRIRQSLVFGDHGIDLFVCGDQLLRGAALNAVLIAEFMEIGDYSRNAPLAPTRVFNLRPKEMKILLFSSIVSAILVAGVFITKK